MKQADGVLIWSAAEKVTPVVQHAWSDEWVEAVPVRPDATDDEIQRAVRSECQSSFGALRWMTYCWTGGRDSRGRVLIDCSCNLCD